MRRKAGSGNRRTTDVLLLYFTQSFHSGTALYRQYGIVERCSLMSVKTPAGKICFFLSVIFSGNLEILLFYAIVMQLPERFKFELFTVPVFQVLSLLADTVFRLIISA